MGVTLGVDAGSREVKFAAYGDGEVVFRAKVDTVRFYLTCRNGAGLDLSRLPELAGAPRWRRIVATGYGRNNVNVKGGVTMPEIMAHARGAMWQTGLTDFTLVDLGGQDTKVIAVKEGAVDDFVMNDKCAAGSGRYLENIARALGASLDELGAVRGDAAALSATCAIFGESEVVGLVSEGVPVEAILAGANQSVVKRLAPMIARYRPKIIVATGGVARNGAVRAMLAEAAGVEVITPSDPQHNGAIGCAVA